MTFNNPGSTSLCFTWGATASNRSQARDGCQRCVRIPGMASMLDSRYCGHPCWEILDLFSTGTEHWLCCCRSSTTTSRRLSTSRPTSLKMSLPSRSENPSLELISWWCKESLSRARTNECHSHNCLTLMAAILFIFKPDPTVFRLK